jgi:aminoacrylate hydrolase
MTTTLEVMMPDGARITVHRHGVWDPTPKRVLVLISGLGGTAGFWKPVIEALPNGTAILTLDQRGIGASTRGAAPVSISRLAQDCLEVIAATKITDCVVVGHSTGGCIAQELALLAPEIVKGLVLSATWLKADPYMTALFTHRKSLLTLDPAAYVGLGTIMGYAPQWLTSHWHVYEGAMRNLPRTSEAQQVIAERIDALLAFDGTSELGRLSCPVLTIGSQDDAIIPISLQKALHAALLTHHSAGQCQFHGFDQGGHFFPVSRTSEFCAKLSAWMDGLK